MKRLAFAMLFVLVSVAFSGAAFAQCNQDTLRAWITDDAHNNRDTLRAWLEDDLNNLKGTLRAQIQDDGHNDRDTLRAWLENDLNNLHDTLRAQIEARIDAVCSPSAPACAVDTFALEEALLRKEFIASIYLPNALGGKLEEVRTLVQQTIATTGGTPEGNNGAAAALSQEAFLWSTSKWKTLFTQYATAYCKAVSPQSRLALCN